MFLEISQNSQENTCVRASFLIKLQASGLKQRVIEAKKKIFLEGESPTLILKDFEKFTQKHQCRDGLYLAKLQANLFMEHRRAIT